MDELPNEPCTGEDVHELHDQLFDWLDTIHEKSFVIGAREVARLFGELTRRQLFSYDRYIRRLISRCDQLEFPTSFIESEKADLGETKPTSPHAKYLRDIPLIKTDAALERQRKTVLYGHRSRQTEEDKLESAVKMELAEVIPYFFVFVGVCSHQR
jgi:hypothetical protein